MPGEVRWKLVAWDLRSINVRLSVIRKLAAEAADNSLLAPEIAAGILRVKGAKSKGVRVGNWLSHRHTRGNDRFLTGTSI